MEQMSLRRFYYGNSMRGTFHPGDCLILVSATMSDIGPGDIVVFQKPDSGSDSVQVVHRVISVTEIGLITRGDYNLKRDVAPVQLEKVVGKVRAVERMGKTTKVIDGRLGLWWARICWMLRQADFEFRRIFRRSYHFLRLSGLAPKFWKPAIQKMHLNTENGLLVKYLHRQQVVATWDTIRQRFDCRKPFDLVIPSPLEEEPSPTHAKLD